MEDWYNKQVETYGKQKADCMRSRLKVVKSRRRYNNPNRLMPGAVFLYQGVRYVMRGSTVKVLTFRQSEWEVRTFLQKNVRL